MFASFATRGALLEYGGIMSDTKKPQDEAPAQMGAVIAILAAIGFASVMVVIGAVSDLGSGDANAAPVVLSAPDQVVSPEEHSAFIRQGHIHAAHEGEDSPLPPTF
jgi:hypothetical protein